MWSGVEKNENKKGERQRKSVSQALKKKTQKTKKTKTVFASKGKQ